MRGLTYLSPQDDLVEQHILVPAKLARLLQEAHGLCDAEQRPNAIEQ
jgi:hypothetical protein